MSEIPDVLPVLHPVPVRFLPRRGRHERLAYARALTQVRLTRVDPSDLRTALPMKLASGMPALFSRIGEGTFLKASAPDGPGARAPDFADFLVTEKALDRETQMQRAFAGTPVSGLFPVHGGDGRPHLLANGDWRGDPDVLRGAGEILHDGTEAARAALQAFFDRSVRIVGRRVYVETGGPMFVRQLSDREEARFRASAFPRERRRLDESPAGPLTRAEALEGWRVELTEGRRLYYPGEPVTEDEVEAAVPYRGLGTGVRTETALLFANAAPRELLDMMAPAVRAGTRGPLADETTRAGVEHLRWLALLGGIGRIEEDAAHAAVRHVAEVALWAMRMPQVRKEWSKELKLLHDHCRDWILPRLDGARARVDADDVEALGCLAPP